MLRRAVALPGRTQGGMARVGVEVGVEEVGPSRRASSGGAKAVPWGSSSVLSVLQPASAWVVPGRALSSGVVVGRCRRALSSGGNFLLVDKYDPGLLLRSQTSRFPLLFFGAGRVRYPVRVGAFAQHLVRKRHAAGSLAKGEGSENGSVTNTGGRDFIGALLRHKTDEPTRPGSDGVAVLPRRSGDCTTGIGGKDSGGNCIGMAFGRRGLGHGGWSITAGKK